MLKKIRSWWIGEEYYIENVFPGIRYKRHWTAITTRAFVNFYLNHWKWVWSTIIAVSSLIIAYLKLT
ncbi:MAG TPA: hypothetical protein CFH84_03340 [Sulfurimonas sp. UBA12504]|nr:MAG TPA: hypothetical protein CFH84_03340 [Sulfurimonas sp. UBA12504]